jgi:hypothetical protein
MEIWKDILVEDLYNYQISNLGRIRNKKSQKILQTYNKLTGHEYIRISLKDRKDNFYIHRLVLLTFSNLKYSEKLVNHINNNPRDNRLENLEFVTDAQNSNRTIKNKNRKKKIIELYNSRNWNSAKEFLDEILHTVY